MTPKVTLRKALEDLPARGTNQHPRCSKSNDLLPLQGSAHQNRLLRRALSDLQSMADSNRRMVPTCC